MAVNQPDSIATRRRERKWNLPLRGRSRRQPTTRAFTFTRSWEKSLSPEAVVKEMHGGRGQLIHVPKPSSSTPITKYIQESPVPMIITSPLAQILPEAEESEDEESLPEEGQNVQPDDKEKEKSLLEEDEAAEAGRKETDHNVTLEYTEERQTDADHFQEEGDSTGWTTERIIFEDDVVVSLDKGQVCPIEQDMRSEEGLVSEAEESANEQSSIRKSTYRKQEQNNIQAETGQRKSRFAGCNDQDARLFDEHIEGGLGHFANSAKETQGRLQSISRKSPKYKRPLLQRHSTPIPNKRAKSLLETVIATPRDTTNDEQVASSVAKKSTHKSRRSSPPSPDLRVESLKNVTFERNASSSVRSDNTLTTRKTYGANTSKSGQRLRQTTLTGQRLSISRMTPVKQVSAHKANRSQNQSDLSTRFVTATPKSGPAVRSKRIRRPVTLVLDPKELLEMPEDVRIWQGDCTRKRTLQGATDLDVILDRTEETAYRILQEVQDTVCRKAIGKLAEKMRKDFRGAIVSGSTLQQLKNSVTKNVRIVRLRRKELLVFQQENTSLKAELAELRQQQPDPCRDPRVMKEISAFLSNLGQLQDHFVDMAPSEKTLKDLVTYGTPSTVLQGMKENVKTVPKLQTVNRRLELWLEAQAT